MKRLDKSKLKELVANDQLEEVLSAMLQYANAKGDDNLASNIVLQINKFKDFDRQRSMVLMEADDLAVAKNQLVASVLELIDGIEKPPAGKLKGSLPDMNNPLLSQNRKGCYFVASGITLAILATLFFVVPNFIYEETKDPGSGSSGTVNPTPPAPPITQVQKIRSFAPARVLFLEPAGRASFEVLSGTLTPMDATTVLLSLKIRLTTLDKYSANLWDQSFRLNAPGLPAPLAPIGGLNEIVDGNSYKDETVKFEIPASLKQANFEITFLEKTREINLVF